MHVPPVCRCASETPHRRIELSVGCEIFSQIRIPSNRNSSFVGIVGLCARIISQYANISSYILKVQKSEIFTIYEL